MRSRRAFLASFGLPVAGAMAVPRALTASAREKVPRQEAGSRRIQTIDFRARPNVAEYMRMYPASAGSWKRFGYPAPPTVSLAEFVANVEANGIDKAVFTGRQVVSGGRITRGITNDFIADCAKQFPDRIIGVAGIDPLARRGALREMERSVKELGLRGISVDLYRPQIFADDRLMYPIYEKAIELGVPVVSTMGALAGKFGDPAPVDQVAADFPELTFVCSHGCYPWVTEFIGLAYRRPNVILELSIYHFLPGGDLFVEAANTVIPDQVIYASAFPFNPLSILGRFQDLPFTPEALSKVLYENSARILGL